MYPRLSVNAKCLITAVKAVSIIDLIQDHNNAISSFFPPLEYYKLNVIDFPLESVWSTLAVSLNKTVRLTLHMSDTELSSDVNH